METLRLPSIETSLLETLAAELTLAAYRVAIRTPKGTRHLARSGIRPLEGMADTVKTWGVESGTVPIAGNAACTVQRR